MDEIDQLKEQLEHMRQQLHEEKLRAERVARDTDKQIEEERLKTGIARAEAAAKSEKARTVYMSPLRRLERFKSGDQNVYDFVDDVRAQLQARNLDASEQAAFMIDNLGGKARREIIGRGDVVSKDPEKILEILTQVFGDGSPSTQRSRSFYLYEQEEGEDIIDVSLRLVELFDRMVEVDPTCQAARDRTLKNQFTEAVNEESVKVEVRRLNQTSPKLSFFEMRDRIREWCGRSLRYRKGDKKHASVAEADTSGDLIKLIQVQNERLDKQQQLLEQLLKQHTTHQQRGPLWKSDNAGPRKCYRCSSEDHLIRNCPVPKPGSNSKQGSVSKKGSDDNHGEKGFQ